MRWTIMRSVDLLKNILKFYSGLESNALFELLFCFGNDRYYFLYVKVTVMLHFYSNSNEFSRYRYVLSLL